MNTVQITESNFEATVKQGLVILDFWASWCGPCRAFAPVFEAAATRHPDVVFAKVDTEAEQGLAAAFHIQSIPTVMVIRQGVVLYQQPGMLSATGIDQILDKARALDMHEVLREIAAQDTSAPRASAAGRG